jgi:uncharacterized protein YjiS (DUF1127 family)
MSDTKINVIKAVERSEGGNSRSWLIAMSDKIEAFVAAARQRRQLQRLDDHMLKDIGLSRADVHRELHRPLWNATDKSEPDSIR